MSINRCYLKLKDNSKARQIYNQMDFYGQMDNYNEIQRKTFNTSWRSGLKNHEWEQKTYVFTDAKNIEIRLRLKTPHDENNHPISNKESLDIIIFKKKGKTLKQQEIENTLDKIGRLVGVRDIKKFI